MAGAYGAANDTQGSVRPVALSAEGGPGESSSPAMTVSLFY